MCLHLRLLLIFFYVVLVVSGCKHSLGERDLEGTCIVVFFAVLLVWILASTWQRTP